VSALGHKDIGGLDVAVYDAFAVGGVQSIGDFNCEGKQRLIVQDISDYLVFQGRAIEKLHGNEPSPFLFSNVMNRADIGMIERGGCLSFALKTRHCLGITAQLHREEFKGDKAKEARVLGFVDHTHPAATESLDDSVMGKSLADHWCLILGVWLRRSQRR
jgi:hypothetical protein